MTYDPSLDRIPKFCPNVSWQRLNKEHYLLECEPSGLSLQVSLSGIKILQMIDGKRGLFEICELLDLERTSENILFLDNLIFKELSAYSIIENKDKISLRGKKRLHKTSLLHYSISDC